jgi:hypothetical protein
MEVELIILSLARLCEKGQSRVDFVALVTLPADSLTGNVSIEVGGGKVGELRFASRNY